MLIFMSFVNYTELWGKVVFLSCFVFVLFSPYWKPEVIQTPNLLKSKNKQIMVSY